MWNISTYHVVVGVVVAVRITTQLSSTSGSRGHLTRKRGVARYWVEKLARASRWCA